MEKSQAHHISASDEYGEYTAYWKRHWTNFRTPSVLLVDEKPLTIQVDVFIEEIMTQRFLSVPTDSRLSAPNAQLVAVLSRPISKCLHLAKSNCFPRFRLSLELR